MRVYTFSEARQNFASILELAQKEGVVRINRRDGKSFVIQPVEDNDSPLNIKGVNLDLSADEIVDAVREGRERNNY